MSLKKSLAWMTIAQTGTFVLQFGASVIIARYLTPREMGVYGVGFAIVSVISIIQQLGLPVFLVREERLTAQVIATAFSVNAVLSVLLSIVVWSASYAGGSLFTEPGVERIVRALAIMPLFGILAFVPSSLMEREGRFSIIAVITLVTGTVTAISSVAGVVTGHSYMSLAYGQLIGVAVNCLLMIVYGRKDFHLRIGFLEWRRVAIFSSQMLFVSGLNTAASRLSEISLGKIVSLAALGLYNRASGMNNMLWSNIYFVVSRVLLVEISDLHRSGASLHHRYIQSVSIMTAVMWPAFAGLVVLAKPVIVLVYGARWLPALPAFVLLAISSMVWVPLTLTGELFAATGRLGTRSRIELIRSMFILVAFVLACFVSLEAAAATRILDGVLAWVLYRPHLNAMTDTRTRDLFPHLAKGIVVTLLAVAPAAAATLMAGDSLLPLWSAGVSIILGILLWAAGLAMLDHPLWPQIRLVFHRVMRAA